MFVNDAPQAARVAEAELAGKGLTFLAETISQLVDDPASCWRRRARTRADHEDEDLPSSWCAPERAGCAFRARAIASGSERGTW